MSIFYETIITKFNFFILFVTMLLYWFNSTLLLSPKLAFTPDIFLFFSFILQTSFLGLRWLTSGHFPISNLYESLLFLSWVLTALLFYLNTLYTKETFKTKYQTFLTQNTLSAGSQPRFGDSLVGSLMSPLILLLNTFATFSLPEQLKLSTALVPALQSNWLLMHVTVMMLSYGALLCGCVFSIAYLIVSFFLDDKNLQKMEFQANSIGGRPLESLQNPKVNTEISNNFNLTNKLIQVANTLDNLSYRVLGLGFPLLTIGLLSGAVWANQTWGSYWSWDPKETWALITWFVFAIYLHTRLSRGWNGRKSALVASFGFVIIWICYLGVNLMGKGLHSYGFFSG
uniref:Cytochrome c biogenesis protein CcsA n=1 Tax=Halochlorococcum sp. NIES-1838 TaxID=2249730 RepID=A0A2Z4MA13_9CHLO|nr:CcsA [Halochlorococcum sp. NIES-1838]